MTFNCNFDVIIVGGGLSGGLTALRLHQTIRDLSIALVESEPTLGGNHTWCFFSTDVSAEQRLFLAPFVEKSWDSYSVRFPSFSRRLDTGYSAVTSRRFHDVVSNTLGNAVITDAAVHEVAPNFITLTDGRKLKSTCVLDARGIRESRHLALGFQKFLALEMELAETHGLSVPVVMDATVSQKDGYRFFYLLPFSEKRLLAYDTYYSDGSFLSSEQLRMQILAYSDTAGWRIQSILREESGVLPIILAGDLPGMEAEQMHSAPRLGLSAAFFHPTTGYSLPDAVRVADLLAGIAQNEKLTTESARSALLAYGRMLWDERNYFRFLNRMLFRAGAPADRYKILERFYRLDTELIQRFYATNLGWADRFRIIFGKPPVPLTSAIACLSESAMLRRR